jgi:hypothetical protein
MLIFALILVFATKGRMGEREQMLQEFAGKVNGKLSRSMWNFSHNLLLVADGWHIKIESFARSREYGTFDSATLFANAMQNHLFLHGAYRLGRPFELQLLPKKLEETELPLSTPQGSQLLLKHSELDARYTMRTTDDELARSIILDEKVLPLALNALSDTTTLYIGPKRNNLGFTSGSEGMISLYEVEVPLTIERLAQLTEIIATIANRLDKAQIASRQ